MSGSVNILFIDNFDSFSFNLVDEFRKRFARVEVWRNDLPTSRAMEIALTLPFPRLIVMSPGPGRPADAGCCLELTRRAQGRIPIFGVCLGHQVIAEAFGGKVIRAGEVVHGKGTLIEHNQKGIFQGLPSPLWAGRYHSLVASAVPEELKVTARARGMIMALEHQHDPIASVQFHPESVLTPQGGQLIARVMDWAVDSQRVENA